MARYNPNEKKRPLFVGEHHARLLDKNRVTFPVELRSTSPSLRQIFVMAARNDEPCIIGYYRDIPSCSKKDLEEGTEFSQEFRLDAGSRVVLPQRILDHMNVGTNGDLVFVGCNNYFEIWSTANWSVAGACTDEEWERMGNPEIA